MARNSCFFAPESIARRLTAGQKSAILHMSNVPALLGCSEPLAFRLCNEKVTRPALCRSVVIAGKKRYALTPLGLQVRAALRATDDAGGAAKAPDTGEGE